jgi:hypothetical protein
LSILVLESVKPSPSQASDERSDDSFTPPKQRIDAQRAHHGQGMGTWKIPIQEPLSWHEHRQRRTCVPKASPITSPMPFHSFQLPCFLLPFRHALSPWSPWLPRNFCLVFLVGAAPAWWFRGGLEGPWAALVGPRSSRSALLRCVTAGSSFQPPRSFQARLAVIHGCFLGELCLLRPKAR